MSLAGEERIREALQSLPGWKRRGNALEKTFDCTDFNGSIAFVNAVAAIANGLDHHPDVTISWNRVTCSLSSHDAGGITERDFGLAHAIENAAPHQQ
jgi:4a-hydroxytetrahydrobiopterin dehydratase